MSKTKPEVWATEYDFIGSTGTNSVRDFAVAILDAEERDLIDALDLECAIDEHSSRDEVIDVLVANLEENGVHAMKVPASQFRTESWSNTIPIDIAARPGRGFVKVIGVLL